MSLRRFALCFGVAALTGACGDVFPSEISLSKEQAPLPFRLRVGARIPDTAEALATGPLEGRVTAGSPAFSHLVRSDAAELVFKDEERTGADRMMTARLDAKLRRLGALVRREWPDLRLRITEAWDERREHGDRSIHYEGRAADLTTSDMDPNKLGRLARLAVDAKLDWVFYEDASHVHVSVSR